MTIQDLKNLSDTNISVQATDDLIQPAEHREVNDAIIEEIRSRGVVCINDIAEIDNITSGALSDTNIVFVNGRGFYKRTGIEATQSYYPDQHSDAQSLTWERMGNENHHNFKVIDYLAMFPQKTGITNQLTLVNGIHTFVSATDLGEAASIRTDKEYISVTDEHTASIRFIVNDFDNLKIGIGNDWRNGSTNGAALTKYDMIIDPAFAGVKLRMKSGSPSGFFQTSPVLAGANVLFLTAESTQPFGVSIGDVLCLTAVVNRQGHEVILKNETTLQSISLFKAHANQFTEYTPLTWGKLCIYLTKGNVTLLDYNYAAKEPDVVFIGNSITAFPNFNDNVARLLEPFYNGVISNYSLSGMVSADLVNTNSPIDLFTLKNKDIILNGLLLAEIFTGQIAGTPAREMYAKLVKMLKSNGNRVYHITANNASYLTGQILLDNQWILDYFKDDFTMLGLQETFTSGGLTGVTTSDNIHPNKLGASYMGKDILNNETFVREIFKIDARTAVQDSTDDGDLYLDTKIVKVTDTAHTLRIATLPFGKNVTFYGMTGDNPISGDFPAYLTDLMDLASSPTNLNQCFTFCSITREPTQEIVVTATNARIN